MKAINNTFYAIKRQIYGLNIEKVLLIVSIAAFYLILVSLRGLSMKDVNDLVKDGRTLKDYKEGLKDFFGLPHKVNISRQRLSDIVLIDPQSIFLKNITSSDTQDSLPLSRNPFYYDHSAISSERASIQSEDIINEKEGLVFVGIISLVDSDKFSVVLKGSVSGEYKTLSEGETWDGITIISIKPYLVRIKNRNREIHEYTTDPVGHIIK